MTVHPQVWVRVNATVDEGVSRLVCLLNEIPHLRTMDSCQGSPGLAGHVFFSFKDWCSVGELLFDRLAPLLEAAGEEVTLSVEIFNGSLPTGKLTFSTEAIPAITSVVTDVVTTYRSSVYSCDTVDTRPHS